MNVVTLSPRWGIRRLVRILLALLLLVSAAWSVLRLHQDRFWPFSTGTKNSAFLRTTFGMSPQEARRALAKDNARLVSYEEYRRIESSPSIQIIGTPFYSEDRIRNASLFMPGIQMFDSEAEAEFHFRDDRLVFVDVHFSTWPNSEALVATLDAALRKAYQFSGREESQEVPGAYRLSFLSSSAAPTLWVNLTDRERPIIILYILSPTMKADRAREIEDRQRTAFGSGR